MSNHRFLDGTIYHKRFSPKEHHFKYKFFMLDIDLNEFETLEELKLFSYNKFNLFSFHSKDHFGKSDNFLENVEYLLNYFDVEKSSKMRFITLPSIIGYVFNPISLLILFEENLPKHMFAEVHNYNGGRVVYSVQLNSNDNKNFEGNVVKDMYVSPFFKRDGQYKFNLVLKDESFQLRIQLFEENKKVLVSNLVTTAKEYSNKNLLKLFFKHTLLTFWVVTRTIYQSIKLKYKGLKWNRAIKEDQMRRI